MRTLPILYVNLLNLMKQSNWHKEKDPYSSNTLTSAHSKVCITAKYVRFWGHKIMVGNLFFPPKLCVSHQWSHQRSHEPCCNTYTHTQTSLSTTICSFECQHQSWLPSAGPTTLQTIIKPPNTAMKMQGKQQSKALLARQIFLPSQINKCSTVLTLI